MLILTSNGLSSPSLLEETRTYIDPSWRRAAIITTASVGYKEKDRHIPDITQTLESLGLETTCVDVEFEDSTLLSGFDIVLLIGGNPYYLLHWLREKNCEPLLREVTRDRMVIGISAGSLVLGSTIAVIEEFDPWMNDEVGLADLTGLRLTDIDILPHYERFKSRYESFEDRASGYEKRTGRQLWRVNDGEAVFAAPNKTYLVR